MTSAMSWSTATACRSWSMPGWAGTPRRPSARGATRIWTMQSAYHNLTTIDGIQQFPGRAAAARNVSYHFDDVHAEFSLDIAPSLPRGDGRRLLDADRDPDPSGARRDSRRILLPWRAGPPRMVLRQRLRARSSATRASSSSRPPNPEAARDRVRRGLLTSSHTELVPTIERLPLDDPRLESSWPGGLWRILFRATVPQTVGTALFGSTLRWCRSGGGGRQGTLAAV